MVSDHNLVTGTVTLKLRKTKRGQERARQFDSKRLKNDKVKTVFRLELINRFNATEEEQELNIANFNQAINEAGVKILGYKTKERKECMKGMAKADKKSFMEGLVEDAVKAARKQDLKTFYRINKNQGYKRKPRLK